MQNISNDKNKLTEKEIITKDLMTAPNAMSFIRILLITPFVAFFVTGHYIPAAVMVGLSGLSDCFDGYVARRFHQESEIGKILDPLADKLTLIACGICLILIEPFVFPLVALLLIKDTLMLTGGTIIIRRGIVPPKSVWYGKVSTVLFYLTLGAIVLMEIIGYENRALTLAMLSVTLLFMVFSLVMYSRMFIALMKKHKEENK